MYSGGSGTIGDPYLIATPQDLYDVRSNLTAYFKQIRDIDLDGTIYDPWTPIGDSVSGFSGDYDGDGHVVLGMYVSNSIDHQGLFGYCEEGFAIRKLGVEEGLMFATSDCDHWGMLVGFAVDFNNDGWTIEECFATGRIYTAFPDSTAFRNVGGLCGTMNGDFDGQDVFIKNCWTDVKIEANQRLGGIIGDAGDNVQIQNCHADGDIDGLDLVAGIAYRLSNTLNNQANASNCSANMDNLTRVFGSGTVFYRINGDANRVTNNYANSAMTLPRTPVSDANGVDGLDKTLAELRQRATYQTGLGWDFSDIWFIRENLKFPELQAFRLAAAALFFGCNF